MSGSSSNVSSSKLQWQNDVKAALPIIDDRLYFTITKCARNTEKIHMFSIDHALRYEPFFVDFGPLNLACLYKFCKLVQHKLKDEKYKNCKLYYYCDRTPQRLSNAAYLIGAFQVIELNRNPQEAYSRIKPLDKGVPFRDASMGLCTYQCTVKHCINAIYNALHCGFLDFSTFNVDEYEHYERVECGDLNIIIPNKFIAFAGPYFKEFDEEGYPALTPDFYIPIWRKFKVTTIIRLNKKCYDKRIFTKAGFEHHDMYFVDGTTPSDQIIAKFIEICENAKGVLAVHCKAGLGRTGSCIGCYMMKHYGWSAAEVIAWLRICRPGSVIGPQQQFLEQQQAIMWKQGELYRQKKGIKLKFDPRNVQINHSQNSNHNFNGNGNSNRRANVDEDGDEEVEQKTSNGYVEKRNDENVMHALPTDPGQNQGAVLKHVKAEHQHLHPLEEEHSNKKSVENNNNSNSNRNNNGNAYSHHHARHSTNNNGKAKSHHTNALK